MLGNTKLGSTMNEDLSTSKLVGLEACRLRGKRFVGNSLCR